MPITVDGGGLSGSRTWPSVLSEVSGGGFVLVDQTAENRPSPDLPVSGIHDGLLWVWRAKLQRSMRAPRALLRWRMTKLGQSGLMRRRPVLSPLPRSGFAGFRFPPEVITVAVRWYLRFGLSYRDVEELLAERGIDVDHVTGIPVGAALHPAIHRRRPAVPARRR